MQPQQITNAKTNALIFASVFLHVFLFPNLSAKGILKGICFHKLSEVTRIQTQKHMHLFFFACISISASKCLPRRSFLLQLATSRGLIWAVEQPLNSLFFAEACMQSMLRAARTHRVMTWMGAFGGHTMKPLELHGCIPIMIALFRKLAKVKSLAIHALGSRKARITCMAIA